MNRKNETNLKLILEAMNKYQTAIQRTIETYSQRLVAAERTSKQFKDENGYVRNAMERPTRTAKTDLYEAGTQLSKTLREKSADLKAELLNHLHEPVDTDFLAKIRAYSDFGIVPCRTEVQSLLTQNRGNSVGLQALSAMLNKVNAPFKLTFKSPEDFENDLSALNSFADAITKTPAVPIDFWPVAKRILNDGGPMTVEVYDGVKFTAPENVDTLQLNFAFNGFRRTVERVEKMMGPWTTDASYELQDRISSEIDQEQREQADRERAAGVDESDIEEPTAPESSICLESKENNFEAATKSAEEIKAGRETYERTVAEYVK